MANMGKYDDKDVISAINGRKTAEIVAQFIKNQFNVLNFIYPNEKKSL